MVDAEANASVSFVLNVETVGSSCSPRDNQRLMAPLGGQLNGKANRSEGRELLLLEPIPCPGCDQNGEPADGRDREQDHERPGGQLECPIEEEPDKQAAGKREHRERQAMQHRPPPAEAAKPADEAAKRI